MTEQFQLFDLLPEDEFSALKADIAKRGVLVPIEFDSDGNQLPDQLSLMEIIDASRGA